MNKNRKGFTIVELVIVIAVIAILAAVLIPTFASLIAKANVSADTQLVKNLNTALLTEKAGGENNKTMYDALMMVKNAGYDIDTIVSKSGNNIAWDSANDRFVLIDSEKNTFIYPTESGANAQNIGDDAVKYFVIYKDLPTKENQKYSIYLSKNANVNAPAEVKVGFDAGENEGVTAVTYTGATTAQTVIIRTNSYKTVLTINDTTDSTINHYDKCGKLVAEKLSVNSYHEFGSLAFAEISSGRVVAEAGSTINVAYVKSESAYVQEKDGGVIGAAYASSKAVKDASAASDGSNGAKKALTFDESKNEEENQKIAAEAGNNAQINLMYVAKVNDNYYETLAQAFDVAVSLKDATVEILHDVDLNGEYWTPVVNVNKLVVNGNGYKIKNAKINGYKRETSGDWSGGVGSGSQATYECAFFGKNTGNLEIKNLTFENFYVDMLIDKTTGSQGSSQIAVLVGVNYKNTLKLTNVNVTGSTVKGYTKVGVLVGHVAGGEVTIDHCTLENNSVILEADGKDPEAALSAVIIGYFDGDNIKTNGIKLLNNENVVDNSVKWSVEIKTENTIKYAVYGDRVYVLSCPTFVRGNALAGMAVFEVGSDGYSYEKTN